MGGRIKVITICDGIIYKQVRWTNVLPFFVKHQDFILQNRNYVKNFLDKANSEYQEPKPLFSPVEYGIDVYDFDNRQIISYQNYCSYWDIMPLQIKLFPEDYEQVHFMWDNEMLYIKTPDSYLTNHDLTYDKALKKLTKKKAISRGIQFTIDWAKFGWKIKKFTNTDKSFNEADECLKEITNKYILTEEELISWEQYKKDFIQ